MKLIDKFKNMFTEEVDVEVDEPVKKEVMQVEIPAPSRKKEEVKNEDTNLLDDMVEEKPKEEKIEEKEEKFSFPVFFDDDDFKEIEKEKKKEDSSSLLRDKKYNEKSYREAYRNDKKDKELYQGNSVVKSTYLKTEPKVFKPTPIISPIYGVLDKNYKKEDITTKDELNVIKTTKQSEITVDDIRKKAYGTLEDDLENNLVSHEDNKPQKEEKDLFEEFEEESSMTREEKNKDITSMIEEELNEPHEDKINDDDLFNLINSMYEDKEED